jgi:hypothetical protein
MISGSRTAGSLSSGAITVLDFCTLYCSIDNVRLLLVVATGRLLGCVPFPAFLVGDLCLLLANWPDVSWTIVFGVRDKENPRRGIGGPAYCQ